jgi:glucose/arabinose dehydrogenase
VIAEFKRASNLKANLASRRVVLVVNHPSDYHFGGWIGFGPDGYLWATTGHAVGTADSVPQDKNIRLAKLLRFNPHARKGRPAQIPPDNPFVGIDGDDYVWAYGMRNPWRASFDRLTNDLWLSDVGLDNWEEVNRFAPYGTSKAANLGWRLCEGNHVTPTPETGDEPCAAPGAVPPVVEYAHADGNCSVTGGYVYRGSDHPSLYGRYFFGDYCTGSIWSIPTDHALGDSVDPPLDTTIKITSFGEDAAGEIYVTGVGGTVWHLVAD